MNSISNLFLLLYIIDTILPATQKIITIKKQLETNEMFYLDNIQL